jgi:mono/diheme cytochrome c family protein
VTFRGATTTTGVESAPAARVDPAAVVANVLPPEGTHPDAGADSEVASLPIPPGATAEEVARGARVFHCQEGGGTCEGCHGSNAKGTLLAPDLTSGKWLWGDGSLAAIARTISDGVADPKNYRSPMPPNGRRPTF